MENYSYKFNNAEHSHLSGHRLAGHKSEETNFNPFKFRFFFWNQYVYSCCLCVITLRWQLALHERITILLPTVHPQPTMSTVPPRLHNVYCATHRRKCYATASRSPGDTGYYCVRDKRLTHIKLIFRGLFSYYEFL